MKNGGTKRTLTNLISFFAVLFLSAVVMAPGAFAQGDLDEDGIPDAEDPETILTSSKELEAGEYTFLSLVVTNGSVLTLKSDRSLEAFKGVTINAENLTIDAGSFVSANGTGYGSLCGPGTGGSGARGARYEEKGGAGIGGPGGPTYGSAIAPSHLGSRGGAIRLFVSGTFTNDGIVSANGVPPPGTAGAGSGGSIHVTTNVLSGSGSFSANGGNTDPSWGGGRAQKNSRHTLARSGSTFRWHFSKSPSAETGSVPPCCDLGVKLSATLQRGFHILAG